MAKKDPFIEAYLEWRRSDQLADLLYSKDLKNGLLDPSEISDLAFDDLTNAVDKAISVSPTTKSGVLKFMRLLEDEFVFEDHYRLQIGCETLFKALRLIGVNV